MKKQYYGHTPAVHNHNGHSGISPVKKLVWGCPFQVPEQGGEDVPSPNTGEMDSTRIQDTFDMPKDISDILIQDSPVFTVITGPDGAIRVMSDSMLRALEYTREEAVGEPLADRFVREGDRGRLREGFEESIRTGGIVPVEICFRKKGGGDLPVRWQIQSMTGDDGAVSFLVGAGIDLSERREMERRLRDSESRYRCLFQMTRLPMFLIDPEDGRVLDANPAACYFFGYTPERFSGVKVTEVIQALEPSMIRRELAHIASGESNRVSFQHRMTDNTTRDLEVFSSVVSISGKPLIYSIVYDVTEQKRMEGELMREREEQLLLFDSIPAMIFYKNRRNRFIRVNRAFAEFYGIPKKEIEGFTMESLFPDVAGESYENDQAVMETGAPRRGILDMVDTRSGVKWLQTDKLPFRDENGEIIGILGFSTDITERKESERRLREEHARLESRLRNERMISEIASLLNTADTLNVVLERIAALIRESIPVYRTCLFRFDQDAEQLIPNHRWNESSASESSGSGFCCSFLNSSMFISGLRAGESMIFNTLSGLDTSARVRPTERGIRSLAAFPLGSDEMFRGAIIFCRESESEWKPEERTLFQIVADMISNAFERDDNFQARIEAERRHTEAVKMAERSSRLASIGTLAAGISHEINQPLTALKVKVDSILYWQEMNIALPTEDLVQDLRFISQQTERIDDIIKHMRALARQEKGGAPSEIHINPIIAEVLSLLRQRISARGIRLDLKLDDTLLPVRGHKTLIHQVVINLLVNAVDALAASPRGDKKIVVETCARGGFCCIEVLDNGPGIPDGILNRLFDPFFTTKIGSEGMGLGLSICHNIVTGFGGTIAVENRPDGGARFIVSIPVSSETRRKS